MTRSHPSKVAAAARVLHEHHGLPDVGDLLVELNSLRKGEAYGEMLATPSDSGEQIASDIEAYVEAVAGSVGDSR